MSPSAFGFFTSSEILLLFSNASTTLLQARLLLFSLRSISSSLLYSPFLPTFNLYRNGNPVAVLNSPLWKTMKKRSISQYALINQGIDKHTLDQLRKNQNVTVLTIVRLSVPLVLLPVFFLIFLYARRMFSR